MPQEETEAPAVNQLSVIEEKKWRQALFTTFTLNLGFFEAYVLPKLHHAHCDDVVVLVDEAFYLESLAESSACRVGREYRLLPIAIAGGVFHAKLTYLSDERDDDVLMVGSGNLTWTGYGHQLECLDVLRASRDAHAFGDFATVLRDLLTHSGARLGEARPWIEEMAERAGRLGAKVAASPSSVRVIGSLPKSISSQVAEQLEGSRPFERLVTMSPFHSPDAGPLLRTAHRLGMTEVAVAVDGHTLETPVRDRLKSVTFVRRDALDDSRPTHAKWWEFLGPRPWLLSGSVNATETSYESTQNFEVATLRPASPAMLGHWLPCTPSAAGVPPSDIVGSGGRHAVTATVVNSSTIKGTFLNHQAELDGAWRACVLRQGIESHLPDVAVREGHFTIHLQGLGFDEADASQLVLSRDGALAIGWLMFEAELQMSREERDFARRVRKLTSSTAESDDYISVIGWLAERVSHIASTSHHPKPKPTSKEEDSSPPPTTPFDYWKWLAQASAHNVQHLSALSACRVAFHALAQFAARDTTMAGSPGVGEGGRTDFGGETEGESGAKEAPENGDGEASDRPLELLQRALEKSLESKSLDQETSRFLLEALLWVITLLDRRREHHPGELDSLPFSQWSNFAKTRVTSESPDPILGALTLAAMSCAFAFRKPNELRTEAFASLARKAASTFQGADAVAVVTDTLQHSPSFFRLSADQVVAAAKAVPELLHYEGVGGLLKRFLADWSAARGMLAPPPLLSANTGGVVDDLRHRRGMPQPYLLHEHTLPEACVAKCYQRFDKSDLAILRNRRALKCIRCGLLHFWAGES